MQMRAPTMKNEYLNLIKMILCRIDSKAQMLDYKVQILNHRLLFL